MKKMKKQKAKASLSKGALEFIEHLKQSLLPWKFHPVAWNKTGIGTIEHAKASSGKGKYEVAGVFHYTVKAPLTYWNSVSGREKILTAIRKIRSGV